MRLVDKYRQEIEAWDWEGIKADAARNSTDESIADERDGTRVTNTYLGAVVALTPSGKYYTPWANNASDREAYRDECWQEALEAVAETHGMWVESGDDPCDIFAMMEC